MDPDGGTANQSTVDLETSGPINLLQDFGYDGTNAISGTLWTDADADGFMDGTESGGLAGVTVVLRDAQGDIVATAVTDANGNYAFNNLPDGTYTVDVTDDANVLDGMWHSLGTSNTDGYSQSDPLTVTLTGSTTVTYADFGYYRDPAGLGNFVWEDLDKDGIQDLGESGLGGVVVTLTTTWPSGGGTTTVKTTTDAKGFYSFGNLLLDENLDGVGTDEPAFSIAVATPATYALTLANQGTSDAFDSDPSGVTATTTEGTVNTIYDFGFVKQMPDITPVITALPNVMVGVTNFEIYVKCIELKGVNTSGLITLRIPKDSRLTLPTGWNGSLTQLPVSGLPVQNSMWTFTEDANDYIFTTTQTITGSTQSTFGLSANWSAGQTRGTYTISVAIVPWSGGEDRTDNNYDAETVDYSFR